MSKSVKSLIASLLYNRAWHFDTIADYISFWFVGSMLIKFVRQLLSAAAPDLAAAIALQQAGEHEKAEAMCRSVLGRSPHHMDALHVLGSILLAQRKLDEAIAALARVTQADPASAMAHYNLASAYQAKHDAARALENFRAALELEPDFAEAYLGAADALKAIGDLDEAQACYRAALARRPDFAEAHYNLAIFLSFVGRGEEAIQSYRNALACNPHFFLAHGNLLFALNCHSSDPDVIYREHREWAQRHAVSLEHAPAYVNRPDAQRRLRIGYLSPDLIDHPVARFMEPVLAHRDRDRFEAWCYYAGTKSGTTPVHELADRWIDCAKWTDEALAARIRADGIDILVDLAGHTRDQRLLVLARKPAPVQATYLGYPTTTGLAAIDYRITDGSVDPPGAEAYNAEQPVRLPHSYYCFSPPAAIPELGPRPARHTDGITFGSFNSCAKLSEASVALWAQVLNAVPCSMLLLKAKDLAEPGLAEQVRRRFVRRGIAEQRVLLHGWDATPAGHFAHYNHMDIALDNYPYNGATTTCEALWMGIPVVTLQGPTHASRMGASILRAAGLPDLVVHTRERYVEICAELASDRVRLNEMRAGLRARIAASALMDAAGFMRAFEAEYRRMWSAWCARHGEMSAENKARAD